MACTFLNPCACVGICTDPPDSDPPSDCTCLDLGYITVYPADSVGCGQTGTVSFTDCYDFCACENDVATITVLDITPADTITINSINTGGMSFSVGEDVDPYTKVEVFIKATCESENTGEILGDHTIITIFIKDLCLGLPACDPGFECVCGECVELPNLTVS